MVDVAIVRRAADFELMVSLTKSDCAELFPNTPIEEGDEIPVSYTGNVADGLTLFPASGEKRGLTRRMKCIAQQRAQKKNGAGQLAWTRVWLPKSVGSVSQYRQPTIVPLEIVTGTLILPPMPPSWHAHNIEELRRRSPKITPPTHEALPEDPAPPVEERNVEDVPVPTPAAIEAPPPPPPPHIVIVALEDHIESILPPVELHATSDSRREMFRKIIEHIAISNALIASMGDSVALAIEDNSVVVSRVYRVGMRKRTNREPGK